ncbi:hypothetical protein P4S72_20050, partial [Vibrio sp. PP-XX7]
MQTTDCQVMKFRDEFQGSLSMDGESNRATFLTRPAQIASGSMRCCGAGFCATIFARQKLVSDAREGLYGHTSPQHQRCV